MSLAICMCIRKNSILLLGRSFPLITMWELFLTDSDSQCSAFPQLAELLPYSVQKYYMCSVMGYVLFPMWLRRIKVNAEL